MTDTTCSGLIVSKGTKLFMASALPTIPDGSTDTAIVGLYDALTWTEIGGIESVGEFGPESSVGAFTPLKSGVACKFKGTTDNGEIALTIAKTTDATLATFLAKQKATGLTAFEVQLSKAGTTTDSHTIPAKYQRYFFNGFVKSAKVNTGSGDDVVKVNSTIVINGSIYEGAAANSAA